MSDNNLCLSCGACCSHFRVSFYWGECASAGGSVPDDLTVQISPSRVAMLGTEGARCRCTALMGEVGQAVACSIYEQRSSTCREFDQVWPDGTINEQCNSARAAFGLPPLPVLGFALANPDESSVLLPAGLAG
ncbi:YkgJ family cysteine cluster protein [Pseudomonas sp. DC3000-4b1]|uniref:YkgJ family cysteine cluster protein n=1 Tax=unclassified Pseudomonas TaxID=196821 RepID=UPI003CF47D8A